MRQPQTIGDYHLWRPLVYTPITDESPVMGSNLPEASGDQHLWRASSYLPVRGECHLWRPLSVKGDSTHQWPLITDQTYTRQRWGFGPVTGDLNQCSDVFNKLLIWFFFKYFLHRRLLRKKKHSLQTFLRKRVVQHRKDMHENQCGCIFNI